MDEKYEKKVATYTLVYTVPIDSNTIAQADFAKNVDDFALHFIDLFKSDVVSANFCKGFAYAHLSVYWFGEVKCSCLNRFFVKILTLFAFLHS